MGRREKILSALNERLFKQRELLNALEQERANVDRDFYERYATRVNEAAVLGVVVQAIIDIATSVKGAFKHLNEVGLRAIQQKNMIATLAGVPNAPASVQMAIMKSIVRSEAALDEAQRTATGFAKQQYREAARRVVMESVSPPSTGSAHYLSFGQGMRAEYQRMIDEFAIALENVIEDTSVESCLQMTATLLDTADLAGAAGKTAERLAESGVAKLDSARDDYLRSYSVRKNCLMRGIRSTELAIERAKRFT